MWRAREELEPWFERCHVRDRWFKLALVETLVAWNAAPDGPNASLTPDYPWYCISFKDDRPIPDFVPIFSDPYPRFKSGSSSKELLGSVHNTRGSELGELIGSVKIESLDDFEKRLTIQFRAQLKAYRGKVEKVFDYGKRDQRLQHAEWTALVFMGQTRGAIAAHLHQSYENAENAVQRGVTRFARDIALTLPGKELR